VAVVASVGAVAVVAAFAIGPWAIRLLYGPEFNLGHRTVGLLAAGSVLVMLARVIAPAVIGLGRHGPTASSWFAGVAAFLVATAAADPGCRALSTHPPIEVAESTQT